MSAGALDLALDIVGLLLIVGASAVLWLPFLILIVFVIRRAWTAAGVAVREEERR